LLKTYNENNFHSIIQLYDKGLEILFEVNYCLIYGVTSIMHFALFMNSLTVILWYLYNLTYIFMQITLLSLIIMD